jgi:hypothetical protein
MNVGKIQNGTNAGWRKVKETPSAWNCPNCRRDNARWAGNCPSCYTERP